jgi:hypothetical protein
LKGLGTLDTSGSRFHVQNISNAGCGKTERRAPASPGCPRFGYRPESLVASAGTVIIITIIIIIIRGATALTNLGRLSSRRWQSFPTTPDGTGLTCGQHIESHSCIFNYPNRTVTSLFK